ncbi:MAG TPA: PEP-CTERM sorting domain-containing protein [Pirellulales bacterium]|jgi:hypothetical protein
MATITVTPDALTGGDSFAGASAPVFFTNYSGAFPAIQVDAALATMDPIGFSTAYQSGDLPDSSGFDGLRLVERVTNNTAVAWSTFHIGFDDPVSLFVVSEIPSTYTITGDVPNFIATIAPTIGTPTSGAASVDFAFASPLLPGESFGMYLAYTLPGTDGNGSAHITQTAGVPEPTTIVLAAVGGLILLLWRRRVT